MNGVCFKVGRLCGALCGTTTRAAWFSTGSTGPQKTTLPTSRFHRLLPKAAQHARTRMRGGATQPESFDKWGDFIVSPPAGFPTSPMQPSQRGFPSAPQESWKQTLMKVQQQVSVDDMPSLFKEVPNSLAKRAAEALAELFVHHRRVLPARGAKYMCVVTTGPGLQQVALMVWDELSQDQRVAVPDALRDFVRMVSTHSPGDLFQFREIGLHIRALLSRPTCAPPEYWVPRGRRLLQATEDCSLWSEGFPLVT